MKPDKPFDEEVNNWSEENAPDSPAETSSPGRRIWLMAGWAGLIFMSAFVILAVIMQQAGVDPLMNRGIMPKLLLALVGLSFLLAVGRSQANLMREQGRSWLSLARRKGKRDE